MIYMINKILISLLMLSSLAFSNSAIQLTTKVTDITLKELIDLGYERTNRIVEANVMFCRSYGIANQEDNKLIEKHNEITRREFTIGVNDGANELVNGKFRFVGVNNKDYLIYKTTIPTKKFTKINNRIDSLQARIDRIELDIKDLQIEVGRAKENLKTKIDKDILKSLE